MKYDVRSLLEMAQNYLTSEYEYRLYLLTFKGGWVPNLDPGKYGQYVKLEATSLQAYYSLRLACKMVNADLGKVLAVAKGMNRFEKREKWKKCAHIGYRAEDQLRCFLTVTDELENYFQSTGRRYPWAAKISASR